LLIKTLTASYNREELISGGESYKGKMQIDSGYTTKEPSRPLSTKYINNQVETNRTRLSLFQSIKKKSKNIKRASLSKLSQNIQISYNTKIGKK
jgi:hypothetical protein